MRSRPQSQPQFPAEGILQIPNSSRWSFFDPAVARRPPPWRAGGRRPPSHRPHGCRCGQRWPWRRASARGVRGSATPRGGVRHRDELVEGRRDGGIGVGAPLRRARPGPDAIQCDRLGYQRSDAERRLDPGVRLLCALACGITLRHYPLYRRLNENDMHLHVRLVGAASVRSSALPMCLVQSPQVWLTGACGAGISPSATQCAL